MLKRVFFSVFTLILLGCNKNNESQSVTALSLSPTQEAIVQQTLNDCAWNYHIFNPKWQACIDEGLAKDPTIAYLWQQKAMPYWKQERYELALKYFNKAVELDPERYLGRRIYLKTIFQKDYTGALEDIKSYRQRFARHHSEQDHSHEFYEALCYLQLGQAKKALEILKLDEAYQLKTYGETHRHFLDDFYLGIAYLETFDYPNAINYFDKVLTEYPQFSDALYYKGGALIRLEQFESGKQAMESGLDFYQQGYTFNEDGSVYEQYPYQVTWEWNRLKN
ncbi:MAG: tetratricopeptide repeat protein [Saprospiraceae bacterium]|nr:tetratricopeptide repeat protein [Saprospiraceae bacterium]